MAAEQSNNAGTDSLSTEEMCREVGETNKRIMARRGRRFQPSRRVKEKVVTRRQRLVVEGKYILASMDVKALYPSIQWERCCEEVRQVAEGSTVDLEQFDWLEFSRYVALNCSDQDIDQAGLSQVIPQVVEGTTLKAAGRIGDQEHLFTPAQAEPNE